MGRKFIGGRVTLSDSEGCIETTSCNQIKYNLKMCGLDTPREKHAGLLDQQGTL
jgi:hypothetical protein